MDEFLSLNVIVYTLLSVGVFQSLIFSTLMYRKKQFLLSGWLALFSFEIISKLLLYFKIALPISQWFGFWFSFDIVYGPLLLLWVLQLLTDKKLSYWHLMHFLPALLYFMMIIPEVFMLTTEMRLTAINAYLEGGQWAIFSEPVMLIQSLTLWHPLFYSISALAVILHSKYKQQKCTASAQLSHSSWLLSMLIVHIIMWFVVIFGLAFIPLPAALLYMLSYLPTVVWINLMTYLSLCYLPFMHKTVDVAKPEKYAQTKLASPQLAEIAEQLEQIMAQGIFSQSRLTLAQVSEKIDVPSHYVSQVINQFYQCNFFDYVNGHRLKSVKKQLKDEQYGHLTILEIALENGFNSKSTFNSAFKKHTGFTPSQFRKQGLAIKCELA
ncbi:AraC family transcriptional regulator [Psychromonas sp. psych-6C06]|uniref:helix-turn-helix domain-containing protein n=1 Tax=Psychromonas sp. psych-6C06 TaxID=2058089 RepID=UPI00187CDFF9|nr:AraC family transcriptional regulator [Psychromonas sp. psych-6C06]